MFWTFFLFPTLLAVNHTLLTAVAPFYNAFDFRQSCEYLAWMNTVFFQSTFTALRFAYPNSTHELSIYFLMYILHDTAHLTFYNTQNLYYIHHGVAAAIAIGSHWLPHTYALATLNAAAFLEASNILLGITWLLNRAGYKNVKIIGGLSVVTYALLRNVFYPYYLFWHAPQFVAIIMSVFVPMNAFWTWKLVKYVRRIGGTAE